MKNFCSSRAQSGVVIALAFAFAPMTALAVDTQPTADPTNAAFIEDTGATERINFSGKLRMLSQRVPAAACNYVAGVDTESAAKIMLGATGEFTKILHALEFGDDSIGVKGEEKRRKTLAALKGLHTEWDPVAAASAVLTQNSADAAALETIELTNMAVLESAKSLVVEITGQYANPAEMVQADALLIDIAGRQRMLSQKMSKEACLAWSGVNADEMRKALSGTMQMFEVSLMALYDGLDAAGIKAAPTPEIKAGLEVVIGEWRVVKPLLTHAAEGADADIAERADVFQKLNVMMGNMNKTVGLYTIYGKAKL